MRATGVSWDVSERYQMENALARERFLLKTLMDNLPDHIYFKDRESRYRKTPSVSKVCTRTRRRGHNLKRQLLSCFHCQFLERSLLSSG